MPRRTREAKGSGCGLALLSILVIVVIGSLTRGRDPAPPEEAGQEQPETKAGNNGFAEKGGQMWVSDQRIDRHTCPSSNCGVVGWLSFREGVDVLESRSGWARVSKQY